MMKYKTIVGSTPEDIDRQANEFEKNHDVRFSTAYALPDGRFCIVMKYESENEKVEQERDLAVVKPPRRGEEGKRWIECPECAKRGVRTNIMVSHFDTCRVCGYRVPVEVLNANR